ncbi:MAG: hydrogenase maturation protease [Clostridium sp.]|uniref:hydrogenase maturation protease n=1 Tax=Clostridium sp. TaxID=1506 RepID=UPI003F31BB32
MVKIFGVGNILLEDDSIGIKVLESIRGYLLNLYNNIEIIIGETDYLYCLDKINEDDFVIILDSTYFGRKPGSVSAIPLKDCDKFVINSVTDHNTNLISIIRTENRNIDGYLIGIEVFNVGYSLELSEVLQKRFSFVCNEVKEVLISILQKIRF